MISAGSKVSINVSSLRKGYNKSCIEVERERNVLPPDQMAKSYKARIASITKDRESIWLLLGQPNKNNMKKWKGREDQHCSPDLIKLYLEMGQSIRCFNEDLVKINKVTRKLTQLTFSNIFMGVARELVDKETYKLILSKTHNLEQQGFAGTHEDWIDFAQTLN